ncbi:MAG: M42 family metallopeptidase [Anaerolineae bacterium]|jgi:putative aminopeptidase FrvX|nr:M42 family metallopeptidase [Chloroflexota bacterium]
MIGTATIDQTYLMKSLVALLEMPSPTGYHRPIIAWLEGTIAALGISGLQMVKTRKGALCVTLPGTSPQGTRALSGHIDTLGAMVRAIKPNGRLMLTQLGGYAWNAVESENVTVYAVSNGRTVRGTIQTVSPSVHTGPDVYDGKRNDERMEVRLDARTSCTADTRALGIDVGDFVFFDPRVECTDTGYIKSRHLDDKAGVAVMLAVLQALAACGGAPAVRTSFYFSNYEEVGHGAATGLPADLQDLLVIDMAASTTGEHQNSDEYSVGICAKDSSGPYDLELRRELVALAQQHQIPYRIDTYPRYGSDGSALLRAGGDVRVGLIGPGLDASHAYERTHVDSLMATARLALAYVQSTWQGTDVKDGLP